MTTTVDPVGNWSLSTPPRGELRADLLMAVDPSDPRYDRTIVTVRSALRPFSFAADEVARGDRILIDDLGVLVTRADDPITLDEYRAQQREQNRKTIYARVLDEPEQTLARAWADMPLKRPLWFVHGLPGNRNAVRQYADGSLRITANPQWFKNPTSPRDTARKLWSGDHLGLRFGFPAGSVPGGPSPGGRALRDGWLPVLRTWRQEGPLYYEQTTVLDTLAGDLTRIPLDEPTVLLMRVRIVNTSDRAIGTARLRCTSQGQDRPEKLTLAGDRMLADFDGQPRVRYLVDAGGRGDFTPDGDAMGWSLALAPGATHELQFRLPAVTLTTDEELAALRGLNLAERLECLCAFWRDLTAQGTQITTPEPWLTDFYKAHLGHLLVNCLQELGYPAGDHFKTSDEAQVTGWLRLMFVREAGRDLYLGQALPRCWLADGHTVSIARAATHFGPLSFTIESHAAGGEIRATLTPPERNRPDRIYVRLRHPDARPLQGVTVNGRESRDFDAAKEWLVLRRRGQNFRCTGSWTYFGVACLPQWAQSPRRLPSRVARIEFSICTAHVWPSPT